MRAVDVVVRIESAGTARAKDSVIQQAWDSNVEDFFIGVQMSCDAQWSMPLSKVPAIDEEDDGKPGDLTFAQFVILRDQLAAPGLDAEAAKELLYDAADRAGIAEWNFWYRRILLKTLHTTLPMDRIIHVLKKLTA